jgi:hypothetical protein
MLAAELPGETARSTNPIRKELHNTGDLCPTIDRDFNNAYAIIDPRRGRF